MAKKYVNDCENVIFPFGSGAPVCLRVFEQTKDRKDLLKCDMRGCKFYKAKISLEKEETKNEDQTGSN